MTSRKTKEQKDAAAKEWAEHRNEYERGRRIALDEFMSNMKKFRDDLYAGKMTADRFRSNAHIEAVELLDAFEGYELRFDLFLEQHFAKK